MLKSLSAVIKASLEFVEKHTGCPLDPTTFLTEDQLDELAALDAQFFAWCRIHGLSLAELDDPGSGPCRNLRIPFILGTCHVPIQDGADGTKREIVSSGMVLFPTFEWQHAMKSLLAAAELLEANGQLFGKGSTSAPSNDQIEGANTIPDTHGDDQNTGRAKRRGRPDGSKTQAQDLKLYSDWKAAKRETGMSKSEFLRARGLALSELAAIERGRKQANKKKQSGNK